MNKKLLIAVSIGLLTGFLFLMLSPRPTNIEGPIATDKLIPVTADIPQQEERNIEELAPENKLKKPLYVKATSVFPKQSEFEVSSPFLQWDHDEIIRIRDSNMTDAERRKADYERRVERSRRGTEIWNQGNMKPALHVSNALAKLRFMEAKYTRTLQAPSKAELDLLKLFSSYDEDTLKYADAFLDVQNQCNEYLSSAKDNEIIDMAEQCLAWVDSFTGGPEPADIFHP